MRPFRLNLTVSILAFLSCLLLMAWLLFSLFAFRTAANDLYAQKGEHARMLLATFVSQLPEIIPTYPEGIIPTNSPAAIFAQKLAEETSFMRLTLLDANGKVIYTTGRDSSDIYQPFSGSPSLAAGSFVLPAGAGMVCIAPVTRNGLVVGQTGLVLSLNSENERLKRSRQLFLAYFALDFIILLGIGAFILSRIVVTPVNRLLAATQKIIAGHYGQRVRVTGSSELAQLAESFNEMSETLLLKDQQVTAHVSALEKASADLGLAREETLRSEKMASIGLLAAGMAHEVGTPLASIMGYAELLPGEQPNSAAIQDYSQRIAEGCASIDRIIRGLLDYAHPHSNSVGPVDIRRLVGETVELLTRQGAFKLITVTSWFSEALPLALIDSHQLQQVLINLLLNSRDAMPEGGKLAIRGTIDSSLPLPGHAEGYVRIDVLDTGTGIPVEHQQRIFDPFFTTKAPGKGTGLGLAISARIIEDMGGRIVVKSQVAKGSCFSVLLPVAAMKDSEQ